MNIEIITTLGLVSSIIVMWSQRKSILQLERDIWDLEQSYKKETGKVYRRKHTNNWLDLTTEEWLSRRRELETIQRNDVEEFQRKQKK